MTYIRQYPWFSSALIFLGLLLAVGIGGLYERRAVARRAELLCERKRREWEKLAATTPGPSAENAAAIESEVAEAERTLAVAEGHLRGGREPADNANDKPPSSQRTDVFFALAEFVERFRGRLGELGIAAAPNERFGFSAYANVGPEPELLPAIRRQRLVIEYLLDALLAAHPRRLLAVERERPRAAGEVRPVDSTAALSPELSDHDLFEIEPAISARTKGVIETRAFRVVFVGQTAVLRAFLRRLAQFDLPVLVRKIEVESAGSAERLPGEKPGDSTSTRPMASPITAAPAGDLPLPLMMPALSKFSVTVELIELTTARPAS